MRKTIGLDIGATGVRAAVFEGRGAKAHLLGFERFDASQEGILNEKELYAGICGWLTEKKLETSGLTIGMQQYMVTSQVADYPQAKAGDLDQIVEVESRQISGFSDKSFVTSYAVMPPGAGRKNPVLLAMCGEDILEERLADYSTAKLNYQQITPYGVALAAAYFELIPEAVQNSAPVLLLDLGQENATATVVAGGQIVYMGTLMFSASKFEQAGEHYLQSHKSLQHDGGVEEYLRGIVLADESTQSEIRQAVILLETEIQNVVEHWRSQEQTELAKTPISQVYLSGGGSRLGGLLPWLSEQLESTVTLLGPQVAGEMAVDLTMVYGLGLISCGKCGIILSLLPKEIRWKQLRQKRWPFLAAACGLLVGCLLIWIGLRITQNLRKALVLSERLEELQGCAALCQEVEDYQKSVSEAEISQAQLVMHGNLGWRFRRVLSLLEGSPLRDGWLIYLADKQTAMSDGDFFVKKGTAENAVAGTGEGDSAGARHAVMRLPENGESSGTLVCAGYTVGNGSQEIQSLMTHLNGDGKGLLRGVDRTDSVGEKAAGQLVWQWRQYLNQNAKKLKQVAKSGNGSTFADNFELFSLILPPSEPDLDAERLRTLGGRTKP